MHIFKFKDVNAVRLSNQKTWHVNPLPQLNILQELGNDNKIINSFTIKFDTSILHGYIVGVGKSYLFSTVQCHGNLM